MYTLDAKRDGRRAVDLATKACESSRWNEPSYVEALAAAYAELGDFNNAVRWQTKAVELKTGVQREQQKREARLKLYQSGKPVREADPGYAW